MAVSAAGAAAIAGLLCSALATGAPPNSAAPGGCGAADWPGSGTHALAHHGSTRSYRLFLPPGYRSDRAAPLVLVFHGWGGDENEFLDDNAVRSEAARRGYVLVAPRGLGSGKPDERRNSWTFRGSATGLGGDGAAICDVAVTPDYRYPSCRSGVARNSCSWTQCQDDDVDFTLALLRHIESQLCIDSEHVYATGGSNGGMFTWELAQNPRSAPMFRAIAPLIGLPHRGYLHGPGRGGALPVMLITGLADDTVPPGAWDDESATTSSNGADRYHYTGATAIVKRWAIAHQRDTSGVEQPFEYDGTAVDCRSYCAASPSRWPAVLDCRAHMGHDYGMPWSWKLILDFFDEH